MKQQSFVLQNKGMNRDLSISKAGQSSAYDNRNIRIESRDGDTLLSVTNERGNKEITLNVGIYGTLIGWNVLNNHIILFTYDGSSDNPNKIYRIDYDGDDFVMVRGKYPCDDNTKYNLGEPLFEGDLGMDDEHPVESVVYFESDDIQKIYWVDGKNVLRFMNFTEETRFIIAEDAKEYLLLPWESIVVESGVSRKITDNTYFDSNRKMSFGLTVGISKDESGSVRSNGTVQYLITYYNKHGQETGYAWMSDLVYLSPKNRGGAGDETNTNRVILKISGLDTTFDHFKVYSIFRSGLDGTAVAYLVANLATSEDTVSVSDDGAHLTVIDTTSLLYLGSQPVVAGTLTHKDQTLFLGDLQSIGRNDYDALETVIRTHCFDLEGESKFVDGTTWKSACVSFDYSDDEVNEIHNIPYPVSTSQYSYKSQLELTSSEILTFKGGEKYRFALKFQLRDGTETDAFWIGDAENDKYPVVDETNHIIKRVVAKCVIPEDVIEFLQSSDTGYKSVQLMIAQATYADRSVKAQGVLCPTMFNTWDRYQNRVYSMPSWTFRPRGASFANLHFEPVHNSTNSSGEIQCNYWANGERTPYFQYDLSENGGPTGYHGEFDGNVTPYQYIMLVYRFDNSLLEYVYIITATIISSIENVETARAAIESYEFDNVYVPKAGKGQSQDGVLEDPFVSEDGWKKYEDETPLNFGKKYKILTDENDDSIQLVRLEGELVPSFQWVPGSGSYSYDDDYKYMVQYLENTLGISRSFIMTYDRYNEYVRKAQSMHRYGRWYVNDQFTDAQASTVETDLEDILNDNSTTLANRWKNTTEYGVADIYGLRSPAYYKKHLTFVDENVVTLSSPEISYESVSELGDGMKLRIVGAAPVHSLITDYTVDASAASVHLANPNAVEFNGFVGSKDKGIDGLTAWPLWKETELEKKSDKEYKNIDPDKLTYDAYIPGSGLVNYWLYQWNRVGNIPAYKDTRTEADDDYTAYSNLSRKTFANLRFSNTTIYFDEHNEYDLSDVRVVPKRSGSMFAIETVDNIYKNYSGGDVDYIVSLPGEHRYPLLYSDYLPSNTTSVVGSELSYLYSSDPINIQYSEDAHAVLSLQTTESAGEISQTILPYLFESEKSSLHESQSGEDISGAIVPWEYRVGDKEDGNISLVAFEADVISETILEASQIVYDSDTGMISAACPNSPQQPANRITSAIDQLMDIDPSRENCVIIQHVEDNVVWMYLVRVDSLDMQIGPTSYLIIKGIVKERVNQIGEKIIQTLLYSAYYDTDDQSVKLTAFGIYNVDVFLYLGTPANNWREYIVSQDDQDYTPNDDDSTKLSEDDKYFLIGEMYVDYGEGDEDTRYGGISLSAVQNNRFIVAGPSYEIIDSVGAQTIYGNQGDTYFQRWDSLKTVPYSNGAANNVIDIASVMLESHINLDGRTDRQRGELRLASIDTTQFNSINPAYSQTNDFTVRRDLDEDFNLDTYRSSITWTLPKADMADVDEWSHVTLASTLKLDGDKGICRALRRYKNSIIAFQDTGIADVLFNSRTQITSQDGVPIEIANSGKVDGKRYISNKYGCVNKWSITEGKDYLYFVDNINKCFCAAAPNKYGLVEINDISAKLGFSAWFRKRNTLNPWTPANFDNFISFFDRVHSDVYIVSKSIAGDTEAPTLVFNESLGVFTSFFDYNAVPMMANVYDRFVSFKQNSSYQPLFLQNEGLYCNFFGQQYPFWVQYRVTPEPYGDKIWTNVEYRADFYRVLDGSGDADFNFDHGFVDEQETYQPGETFSFTKYWNEYQTTEDDESKYNLVPKKDFRIWRLAIPRAKAGITKNIYGLDRIRNPWLNLLFKKNYTGNSDASNRDLVQIHDIIVKYFE